MAGKIDGDHAAVLDLDTLLTGGIEIIDQGDGYALAVTVVDDRLELRPAADTFIGADIGEVQLAVPFFENGIIIYLFFDFVNISLFVLSNYTIDFLYSNVI